MTEDRADAGEQGAGGQDAGVQQGVQQGGQAVAVVPIFLGVDDVAAMLGLSRSRVRRMLVSDELPWVMLGKRRKVPAAALAAWADQQADAAIARQMQRRRYILHARICCN